ncbi:MAG: hypothetical protein AAB927_04025, partial [Patescibacteria group bacterium]
PELQTLKQGNVKYELQETYDNQTLEILRGGFEIGREAAEKVLGFSCAAVPFNIIYRRDSRSTYGVDVQTKYLGQEVQMQPSFRYSIWNKDSFNKISFAAYVQDQLLDSEKELREIAGIPER